MIPWYATGIDRSPSVITKRTSIPLGSRSINLIVTTLMMRPPGMTLFRMPIFVWCWLITAYLLIAVMPVLAGAVTMLLTDQFFGTSFFLAAGGGDPVMFQHIFWFFGHPEVYIMILPGMAIMSEIIPTFSKKTIFGYRAIAYSSVAIAFISFLVWGHHMFTSGQSEFASILFSWSIDGEWPDIPLFMAEGETADTFPALTITTLTAVHSTAAPHLSRPLRRLAHHGRRADG